MEWKNRFVKFGAASGVWTKCHHTDASGDTLINANTRMPRGRSRLRAGALALGSIALACHAFASDSTDRLTGLPLHAGLTFQQEVDSPVCGKKAQMNLFDASADATLSEYIAWYKGQLKGFHYVHKVWSERAQEMFYSPDGTKGVAITGSPSGPGVFAVTYLKISVPLTTHQMDAFDPSNPSCK